MTIGSKLRFLRNLHRIPGAVLAEYLCMSKSNYFKVERGEIDLNISNLQKAAGFFNLTLQQLLQFDTESMVFQQFGNNSDTKSIKSD